MSDASQFLAEADYDKHPSFFQKDTAIGTVLSGVIVEEPRVVQLDDLNTPGQKVPHLVLAIQRTDDGQTYALWVKKGALASAVAKAAKDVTGKPEVAVGGTLHVKLTGVAAPTRPGFNGAKQWAAKYEAPAPSAGADQSAIFDD